jgi:hypothetical protein
MPHSRKNFYCTLVLVLAYREGTVSPSTIDTRGRLLIIIPHNLPAIHCIWGLTRSGTGAPVKSTGPRGIEKANVAPGPSFSFAHRRPW